MMKKITLLTLSLAACLSLSARGDYVSKVWSPDNGDGTYKNPVIYADYSDPDVCVAGSDYYMTASSFHCVPGLPILHSKDMVNWTLVGHALQKQPPFDVFDTPRLGWGVWAPSIRYHNNEFYIYYGDPDYGIYMIKTKDPRGVWDDPVLVKAGKGLIDVCPLWDEDGRAYIAHALAGSRAGLKSVIVVNELTPDGTKTIGEGRIVFDGHESHETIEGAKFYKHDGYYYIFAPAGGVATGWQVVLRSKDVFGPYEIRTTLAQGKTDVNGPHQGAWVQTPDGREDWFFHFQDKDAYGRVVHLQPMKWNDGWPVMGVDKDGDGVGEPVATYKKPNVGGTYPAANPVESDEFDSRTLGLQWQWQANPQLIWAYHAGEEGRLRLFSTLQPETKTYNNLSDTPNMLLQKFPAEEFSAVAKINFKPLANLVGERAGFMVFGRSYALLSLDKTADGITISQVECPRADTGGQERVNATERLTSGDIYVKLDVRKGGMCTFAYSYDGKRYTTLGKEFKAVKGSWVGAKVGFFANRPVSPNYGGWLDVESFTISTLD